MDRAMNGDSKFLRNDELERVNSNDSMPIEAEGRKQRNHFEFSREFLQSLRRVTAKNSLRSSLQRRTSMEEDAGRFQSRPSETFHNLLRVIGTLVLTLLLFPRNSMGTKTDLFTCSFESGICGLLQSTTDDFSWTRMSGMDPTPFTGPLSGVDDSEFYFYIDTSPPVKPLTEARFTTQDLNYIGAICVSFFYQSYGVSDNELTVFVQLGGDYATHVDVWTVRGEQGNVWIEVKLNIRSTSNYLRIGWNGVSGVNELSDIAIDEIHIDTGRCPIDQVNLPFVCDFETGYLCGMTQGTSNNYDWIRMTGSYLTPNTGPSGAISGSYYMLMNASAAIIPGYQAILLTPTITYTGMACVVFYFYMWGRDVADLLLYTAFLGQRYPWTKISGNQGNQWLSRNVTISLSNDTDKVGFVGVRGNGIYGNIAIDDLQITGGVCPGDVESTIVDLPFGCTFELDFCSFIQPSAGNFRWLRLSGPTDSLDTGPDGAAHGIYYIYVESSAPAVEGQAAFLYTQSLAFSGVVCVSFEYNMYGFGIGRLTVFTSYRGKTSPVFSLYGNQGPQWIAAQLNVTIAYAEKVVFVAYRGPSPFGDIALDDILVTSGPCSSSSSSGPGGSTVSPSSTTYGTGGGEGEGGDLSQFPVLSCDLEGDGSKHKKCQLVQDLSDNFDWTITTGRTPSGSLSNRRIGDGLYPVTGPEAAEQGKRYAFIEATGRFDSDLARLVINGTDLYRSSVGEICLHLFYSMNGFHCGLLRVYSRDVAAQEPPQFLWTMSGDQGSGWKSLAVHVQGVDENLELGLEATTTGEFSGDISIDNLTVTSGVCQTMPSPYLWLCNFELSDGASTMCDIERDPTSNFDWTIWTGDTPSLDTGPSKAFNGAYYFYMEASAPRVDGEAAEFLLPSTVHWNGTACLEYYYHMYGFHMGSLQVYMRRDQTMSTLWSLSGDQNNIWIENRLTVNLRLIDQIGFRGIRGLAFSSDLALDNIRLTPSSC